MLLQMIGESSHDINNNLTTSHELANDLRDLYDLPPLSIEEEMVIKSSYIITNLNGFLKDYATTDSEDSPIDVIKFIRENIS